MRFVGYVRRLGQLDIFNFRDRSVLSVLCTLVYCLDWREPYVPHHGIDLCPADFGHDLRDARSIAKQLLSPANAGRVPTNSAGETVLQSSPSRKLFEDSADLSAIESFGHAATFHAAQKIAVAKFRRSKPIFNGLAALSAQTNRYAKPRLISL